MATQYGEDQAILRYFDGHIGRFFDVGAGDGVTFSNTEPLLRAGWSGVMVEPAISQLRWLIENHGDNPRVEIIPAAIEQLNGCVRLHDGRNYSTTEDDFRKRIEQHADFTYRERVACSITWDNLRLWYFPEGAAFVNIDVEGNNLFTLEQLPFDEIQPQMVCIEIDPEDALPLMIDILAGAGLTHTLRVGGNLLAARREII